MATCGANGGKAVTAIASLGQCVGPEAQANAFVDDLVDDGRVGPLIKVVYKLRALVAEKSSVFKLDGTFHALNASPH